jgi:thioredoxin reductase/ferredoxin
MSDQSAERNQRDFLPDGTLILDAPVTLPDVLDVLIVGGGPFGTAAAFRAKELGLAALVIDYDDLLKRIRDYAKDKLILPDFGGGDKMQFPKGGDLIASLQFGPIDKDAMCAAWKALYRRWNVPARIGVEMTGMEDGGGVWRVDAWNHFTKTAQAFNARHVVLGFGRGVPRRLDIPGRVEGLAFNLTDPSRYVGKPACVIGGGTSAAEAVISISSAKCAESDDSGVYWSYRAEKMPKVSRALAPVFFDAYVGNGNIRYLPKSEPVAIMDLDGGSYLTIRTDRRQMPGRPVETTQLEFEKLYCIACIGEDIPEALLNSIGIPLVTGGPANKKRILVSPLLETGRPNVFLAGDILSPVYFEAPDLAADPSTYEEIKRRGNIKAAMRDGVLVAEVIAQKLAGRTHIHVHLDFVDDESAAEATRAVLPAAAERHAPRDDQAFFVSVLPTGVEANEFDVRPTGVTTLGRQGADICFAEDTLLSDRHAAIERGPEGYMVRDEGSARGVFLQPSEDRAIELPPGSILKAGQQWLVYVEDHGTPTILHYNAEGRELGRRVLKEGVCVVGRQAPDWTLDASDDTLSRRHLALKLDGGRMSARDLKSVNGTLLKIDQPTIIKNGDRLWLGQQLLKFICGSQSRPAADVVADTIAIPEPKAAAPAGPSVTFANRGRTVSCIKGMTLCEAAESANLHLDADCHQGVCGMDPVRVLSGQEHLNAIGDTERSTLEDLCSLVPGQYRLACMARLSGPVVVEILKG